MSKTILIQDHLRPALPTVLGCRDYQQQEQLLVRADRILRVSGVERLFVGLSLERYQSAAAGPVSQGDLVRHSERSEKALRCTVLKNILGEDYRETSVRLAQCELLIFGWFRPDLFSRSATETVRIINPLELIYGNQDQNL